MKVLPTLASSEHLIVGMTTTTLARVGFIEVEARDRNAWYRDLARRELTALEDELQPLVVARIGRDRAEHFIRNWRQMVLVLDRGSVGFF